jgi:hypothetical protein
MHCADFLSSAILHAHPNTRTNNPTHNTTRNEGSPAVLRYRYHNERTSLSTEAGPLLRVWPSCVYHNSEGKNRLAHLSFGYICNRSSASRHAAGHVIGTNMKRAIAVALLILFSAISAQAASSNVQGKWSIVFTSDSGYKNPAATISEGQVNILQNVTTAALSSPDWSGCGKAVSDSVQSDAQTPA